MDGRACIRGMGVTAGLGVGRGAIGHTPLEILNLAPCLQAEDMREALSHAAWRAGPGRSCGRFSLAETEPAEVS